MARSNLLYKLPQGTERLVWEEAFKRQILTHRIQNLFTRWGYLPVQTPVFDFYDLYAPFLGKTVENVYRLVDREGDLLLLRSDITLFLARSMGLALKPGHKPLRVCYADSTMRHQDLEDISANEFFQVGAEFIGSPGPESDIEILLLLEDVLDLFALVSAKVHVGSREVFDHAFSNYDDALRLQLLDAVLLRKKPALESILEHNPCKTELLTLFNFLGSADEALKMVGTLKQLKEVSPKVIESALTLIKTVQTLNNLGFDRFLVDFSETGRWTYYTGLVFQVYYPGLGDAIATGGRYDGLMEKFGLKTPSVGFSLMLGQVEPLVDFAGLDSPSQAQSADGKTIEERWKNAQALRKAGKIVTL